ncbi:aspartate/glutamate racemase family protein [Frischella sp. Ac13]|uniref:Aspartate/glutamate racemase family protein n=1 Tax=Frischella japonica TaxID=2741544 RepID=A0ABR7QVY2_9GAMM|nr:aspartate/glutamate racemase family protein [Frischella japonica]MBC9130363.1 aspartate/glutamate racemase family protein [Frischella japonica]
MKTIGLIGGMSWESTATYYQIINQVINKQLGGLHSAKCVLYSVDFQEIEQCQSSNDWQKSAQILLQAALSLQKAGADFIVICTNTMHKVVPQIIPHLNIPILHIAEMTVKALKKQNMTRIALLGTKYTMEQHFYREIIIQHGIEVIIPDEQDRQIINDIIFKELCLGVIKLNSKNAYLAIIDKLCRLGVQGVILGCTEIGLLINQNDTAIPLFDTSLIHAQEAALYALG